MRQLALAVLLLAQTCAVRADAVAQLYGLEQSPSYPYLSYASAVSADGSRVVGAGTRSSAASEAFVWDPIHLTRLGVPDGYISSSARDISGDGAVVVGAIRSSSGFLEAAIWTAQDGFQGLGALPGRNVSGAQGVSLDGSLVAGYSYASNGDENSAFEAFVWDAENGMRGLGQSSPDSFGSNAWAISDDGTSIVGQSFLPSGGEAYLWDAQHGMRGLGDLPGGSFFSSANDVSADGSIVVGTGSSTFGQSEAFIWDAVHGIRGLGGLPGGNGSSSATGVSSDGATVIGSAQVSIATFVPFVWDANHGMRRLDNYFVSQGIDLSGWTIDSVEDVSSDGSAFVGRGRGPNGSTAWYAVIPEPASGCLVGVGLAWLAARRRARRPLIPPYSRRAGERSDPAVA